MTNDRSPHIDLTDDTLFDYAGSPEGQPTNDFEATVQRVHRATAASTSDHIPADLKTQIWEDLMHAQSLSAPPTFANPVGSVGATTRRSNNRPETVVRNRAMTSIHMALNVALAAVVVLAVASGIWRATGGWTPGGNDPGNQPPSEFASLAGLQGTPTAELPKEMNPADLPKAEDCTVTPLTIDEVLWYVTDPFAAEASTGPTIPATPQLEVPAVDPGHPDQATLDAVAEVHHQIMSCVLADSWFQIWALESPKLVREQVLGMLPVLTGDEEARSILTDLQDNGPKTGSADQTGGFFAPSEMGFLGGTGIQVLDTNVNNSWQGTQWDVMAGYATYDPDGTLAMTANNIFEGIDGNVVTPDAFVQGSTNSCLSVQFRWNEARQTWLLFSRPQCG